MGMLPKHETHQRIAEAFVLWVAYGKLVDDGQTELEVIASLVAPAVEPEEVAIYLIPRVSWGGRLRRRAPIRRRAPAGPAGHRERAA